MFPLACLCATYFYLGDINVGTDNTRKDVDFFTQSDPDTKML